MVLLRAESHLAWILIVSRNIFMINVCCGILVVANCTGLDGRKIINIFLPIHVSVLTYALRRQKNRLKFTYDLVENLFDTIDC